MPKKSKKQISKEAEAKAELFLRKLEEGDKSVTRMWKEARENRDFLLALERHGGDLVMAVKSCNAGYRAFSEDKCREYGKKILRRDGVGQSIKDSLRAFKVTPMRVIAMIEQIAMGADRDSDKLKALEMLGKWCNIFNQEKTTHVTNNLNISEDAAVRLLERRHRHSIGKGGEFLTVQSRGTESDGADGEEIVS